MLHALARRYERGTCRDDAAVLRDLLALAPGYVSTFQDNDEIEEGADFAIQAPAGAGFWLGAVKSDPPELVVRTFIEKKES